MTFLRFKVPSLASQFCGAAGQPVASSLGDTLMVLDLVVYTTGTGSYCKLSAFSVFLAGEKPG